MKLNTTYQHRHYPERFTCVPVAPTSKGVKVQQTESFPGTRKKDKVTSQHYDAQDFSADKGLWDEKKV